MFECLTWKNKRRKNWYRVYIYFLGSVNGRFSTNHSGATFLALVCRLHIHVPGPHNRLPPSPTQQTLTMNIAVRFSFIFTEIPRLLHDMGPFASGLLLLYLAKLYTPELPSWIIKHNQWFGVRWQNHHHDRTWTESCNFHVLNNLPFIFLPMDRCSSLFAGSASTSSLIYTFWYTFRDKFAFRLRPCL